MSGYAENWRVLYLDNFYLTVKLAHPLYGKKIGCIGIIRKNRKHEQNELVESQEMFSITPILHKIYYKKYELEGLFCVMYII